MCCYTGGWFGGLEKYPYLQDFHDELKKHKFHSFEWVEDRDNKEDTNLYLELPSKPFQIDKTKET
jgi:hypothetical protein